MNSSFTVDLIEGGAKGLFWGGVIGYVCRKPIQISATVGAVNEMASVIIDHGVNNAQKQLDLDPITTHQIKVACHSLRDIAFVTTLITLGVGRSSFLVLSCVSHIAGYAITEVLNSIERNCESLKGADIKQIHRTCQTVRQVGFAIYAVAVGVFSWPVALLYSGGVIYNYLVQSYPKEIIEILKAPLESGRFH